MKHVLFYALVSFVLYKPVKNDQTRYPIPPADYEFLVKEHVEKNLPFVDKSLFINQFLFKAAKRSIVTRPPKWGKSMNLNMLYRFLAIEADANGTTKPQQSRTNNLLFSGSEYVTRTGRMKKFPDLEISKYPEAMKEQGIHPTLHIDFTRVLFENDLSLENFRYDFSIYIGELLRTTYPFLETFYGSSEAIQHNDRDRLKRAFNGTIDLDDIPLTILLISHTIYAYYNHTPVYVLVDGYDRVLNKVFHRYGAESKQFQDIVQVLKDMYRCAFSGREIYIGRVLMTGTLPFLRTEANLSNFEVYTLYDDEVFSGCFGYTDTDMKKLFEGRFFVTEQKANQIMNQYGGFKIHYKTLYNPWSTQRCIYHKGSVQNFWQGRGMELDCCTQKAFLSQKIRDNFQRLIKMEEIEAPNPPKQLKYAQLTKDVAVFPLLVHHGCLTIAGRSVNRIRYKIPNPENKDIFIDEMRSKRKR